MLKYAKIYQIVNNKSERYLGSTTRIYLCQRMAEHEYTYSQLKKVTKKVTAAQAKWYCMMKALGSS